MDIILTNFKWIMLAGGLLTLTMVAAAFAPRVLFVSMFGEGPEGALATLLARNWGVLIGLTGAMLIWGAFHVEARPLVLLVAGTSKLTFIGLVLSHPAFRAKAMSAVVIDSVMVALFAVYLLAT